jgi:tRNA (adenine37-N6)-methyltransferase
MIMAEASEAAGGAGLQLVPIGHVSTPWRRGHCPKNMREARALGLAATVHIKPAFSAGLIGIERASHLFLLGWFTDTDRQVLIQQPQHLPQPQGCFSLRSPARPNPIGLSIARVTALDLQGGRIEIDALDWFDGTLLIDIKPYYPSTDLHPEAQVTAVT